MKIGGHVSMAGGIEKAPERGSAIGANTIQIFASSPRSFKPSNFTDEQFVQFQENAKACGIKDVFLHGVYLINLGTPDANYRETSIRSLVQYLEISHAIGGKGVIFHPGFANDNEPTDAINRVINACKVILGYAPSQQLLLIENSAGAKGQLFSTLDELTTVVQGVGHPQLGFCLDTQHAFAAGIDLRTENDLNEFITQFSDSIGWDKLKVIHCNDSKTAFGSHLDRHENIGYGNIGLEAFRKLLNHKEFFELPFILEVPGMEKKGPDIANVEILQTLIK